jgi:hypothetical protein
MINKAKVGPVDICNEWSPQVVVPMFLPIPAGFPSEGQLLLRRWGMLSRRDQSVGSWSDGKIHPSDVEVGHCLTITPFPSYLYQDFCLVRGGFMETANCKLLRESSYSGMGIGDDEDMEGVLTGLSKP